MADASLISKSPPVARSKRLFLGGVLLVLLMFPLLGFVFEGINYWQHMFLYTFMYIAMASSWNIIGGYTGYTSLGHNFFLAIGAYFSGVLLVYFKISPFLTAPIAGLLALGLGFLFGLISLRTRGPAFIISTIALVLLVKITFDNWDYIGGANGLSLPLLDLDVSLVKIPYYYYMLFVAIAAVYTAYRIRHSKFGLGLRAISQDESKAEVAGIPTNTYKILAFAISGFYVGIAGGIWGYYSTYLQPKTLLAILVAAQLVLMTVLGGKGTVAGPVIGAILFIAAEEYFVTLLGSSELNIAAMGLLLAVVLLFFPEGVVGSLKSRGRLPQFLDWD
ncbi:MAG TPA: branched-chain amino acid ABC transporter permease [Anaerolineales bacterium]|nr:branched-chain amino acid ABC transporter permease [Anaerolineales bacterium]